MWETFVPDVVVAFIGATLTVLIAFMTYLLRLRLEEKRALQSLINELHRRRALAPGSKSVMPDAELTDDYKRANASVLSIRDEIRRTRDHVRQVESRQLPLSHMTRACNRYLEFSAVSPTTYAILLGDLQRELSGAVRVLTQARRDIVGLEPGAGAL